MYPPPLPLTFTFLPYVPLFATLMYVFLFTLPIIVMYYTMPYAVDVTVRENTLLCHYVIESKEKGFKDKGKSKDKDKERPKALVSSKLLVDDKARRTDSTHPLLTYPLKTTMTT